MGRPRCNLPRPYVVQEYLSGKSSAKLAQEFEVCYATILNLLEDEGVQRRSCKHYDYDTTYFDCIDTEEKAYWLGFIAADGCVKISEDHCYRLTIVLHVKDVKHIETFLKALHATIPVRYHGHFAGIGVYCKQIVLSLIKHGIVPRKSLILQWPTTVPQELLRHFLRGYVDGDGCFYNAAGKKAPVARFGFSVLGTEAFLTEARNLLMEQGLHQNKLRQHGSVKCLGYVGRYGEMVYRFLYDAATVFLERKRDTAERLIKEHIDQLRIEKEKRAEDAHLSRVAIAQRFLEGKTVADVAAESKLTEARVYQILNEEKVKRAHTPRYSASIREQAISLWREGVPVKTIARQLGCSHWIVYDWIGPQRTRYCGEIPVETKNTIRTLYLSGKNCREIGELVGLKEAHVYYAVCRMGIPRRPPFRFVSKTDCAEILSNDVIDPKECRA